MNDLLHETVDFTQKIKQSEIYTNYVIAKKNLESKPNLMSEVDEFRKNCFVVQTGHNYGYFNSYEQMVNLKNENDELLSNPLVKAFMDAEFRLTQMLSDIFNYMIESIDFDIDF